jgi:FkbM family methyltransferase
LFAVDICCAGIYFWLLSGGPIVKQGLNLKGGVRNRKMAILNILRKLRHGPLRGLGPVWVFAGDCSRYCLKLLGQKFYVSQKIGGYGPFKLNANFMFSDLESWGDGHNNGFVATVEACRGKKCVLDVGGHIGLVSLPISKVLAAGGCLITFEPSAGNLRYLKQHLQKNEAHNVTLEECLVGDKVETVSFFEQADAAGQNSRVVAKNPELYSEVLRPQVTLDAYCAENNLAPEIIKMDIEGAEVAALKGARNVLIRSKPIVFLSVHPRHIEMMGASIKEMEEFLEDVGYIVSEIDGAPVEKFRLAEYRLQPKIGN